MNRAQAFRRRMKIRRWIKNILLTVTVIFSVFVAVNAHAQWLPRLTWQRIYAFFGVGETPYSDWPCTVRVLNLGASDCILVTCEDQYVLIDTGTLRSAEDVAILLERVGVSQLDCLILTHYHEDHVGAAAHLMQRFDPKVILLGARSPQHQNDTYSSVIQAALATNAQIRVAENGMTFHCGVLAIEVLSDGKGFSTENNRSLVVKLRYKNTDMLFMSDAEKAVEEVLIENAGNLAADWIKIAHHGSNTSSTKALLYAVSPAYAAITCEEKQLPDEEVLTALREAGIQYARTDLHGTILFATDGGKCAMFTENS